MSRITQKLLMDFRNTTGMGWDRTGWGGIIWIISGSLFQLSCEHKLSRYTMNDLFHLAKYLDFPNWFRAKQTAAPQMCLPLLPWRCRCSALVREGLCISVTTVAVIVWVWAELIITDCGSTSKLRSGCVVAQMFLVASCNLQGGNHRRPPLI